MPLINGTAPTARAAAWRLEVPTATKIPSESALIPDDGANADESIIGVDERVLVDEQDIRDGGKYRSIVKILSRFKDKETGEDVWMMGSGWLIRPDLLVTAGHVVYDWGRHLGAATQIKCYIGYNGKASVNSKDVQSRFGQNVVTTAQWIESSDNRPYDVSFIQVNNPYTGNLRNFTYTNTPASDTAIVGVVGYPGDKSLDNGEGGAQMYEQFKSTKYNLDTSKRHMIEYKVSTFGGQSGAPILRRTGSQITSIGTHCYGGGGVDSNSGNSIGGQYGNVYSSFLTLFKDQSAFGTPANIKVKDVAGGSESAEGFLDVLKSIAKVGSTVLPIASGMLGPVGGMVGTAAGALLGSLSEAAPGATESTVASNGAPERAILAEACLQAVLALPSSPESQGILNHMGKNWAANAPDVDAIATAITPQVTECALDIALDRWSKAADPNRRSSEESILEPRALGVEAPESAVSGGQEAAFVKNLFGPTRPVAGEEGMFSWLGPVLKTAITVAKPLVSQAAKAVVTDIAPKLLGQVVGSITGTESAEAKPVIVSSKQPQVKLLVKRALVADTALQALMTLPESTLKKLTVNPTSPTDQTEGIFDRIKSIVQKIGPTVLDTAKSAVKTFVPVLLNAAASKIAESGGVNPVIPAPIGKGGRQPSILDDLLSGAGTVIQVSPVPSALESNTTIEHAPIHLGAELRRREVEWKPSKEPRKSWDSNDDAMPVADTPPDL